MILEKIVSDIENKYNISLLKVKDRCISINDEICAICIDDINNGIITSCGHKYHIECINLYIDNIISKNTKIDIICPICRNNI